MMKMILGMAVLAASVSVGFAQDGAAKPPLAQLVEDLTAGAQNAHLSEAQKQHLEKDKTVFNEARSTREQGGNVDRRKVKGALDDAKQIVDASFKPEDQKKISEDVATMMAARGR